MTKFTSNDPRINRKGRPPGSTRNKLREKVTEILEANISEISTWLSEMEPKDRANFIVRLLEYSLPKMKSIEFTSELEKLSDEDLDTIISKLKTEYHAQAGKNQTD